MDARSRRTPPSIPGYRVERALGEGGMATAWLAVQKSLGREVVLKVLDPALAADEDFVERFVREARVLASLRHRHIVAIHDVGVAAGVPYLAMEFLEEGSTVALCGHTDAATALRCVREIADGLGHAHARGIIHRDVKPENILRGKGGEFVLGDFGIARVSDGNALTAPTAPGLAFGTPAYMAPERWRDGPVDGRSDFYSLGCVLFALLAGRPPFQASEQLALGHKHLSEPVPLLPAPFEALQGLFARLLAKDPDDRHPDAASIVAHVQALEHELGADGKPGSGNTRLLSEWPFGAGEKLLEPVPAATPPGSQTASRSRWLAFGFGALVAVSLLVAGWLSRGGPGETPPPAPKPPVVAVLPFTAEGDDADLGRLADVLSEDLTAQLARVPGLDVSSRASVLANAKQGLVGVSLADRLRANSLVEGGVRRGKDGSFEVEIRLLDGATGNRRWTTSEQGSFERLWLHQREVVSRLAGALVPDARAASTMMVPAVSASDAANGAYLRGRQLMAGSVDTRQLQAALDAFDEALAIDPAFALAHAGKCRVGLRIFGGVRNEGVFAPARSACERAAELDPNAAEVVVALGDLHRINGDQALAIEYYRRVVDDPAVRAEALFGLAYSADALDRLDEAERTYRRAQSLLPGYWRAHSQAGNFYLRRSRYDDAVTAYRTAIALAGDLAPALHVNLGNAYLLSGHLGEAESAYETALANERSYVALTSLGTVRFYLGNYAGAAALVEEAIAIDPDDYRPHGNLADALSMLPGRHGDAQAAYCKAAGLAEKFLGRSSDSVDPATELAWYWANCGEASKARTLVDVMRQRTVGDSLVALRMASTLAVLGDVAGAGEMIERARQLGLAEEIVRATPWLAPLTQPAAAAAGAL